MGVYWNEIDWGRTCDLEQQRRRVAIDRKVIESRSGSKDFGGMKN